MAERVYESELEREVIERALANEELMRQLRESLEAIARGEKGTPGRRVHQEVRARRAGLSL